MCTWQLSHSDLCIFCNCLDKYDHFFFLKCKYNKSFWIKFSKYIRDLTGNSKFQISLKKIIYGWNIHNSKFNFVNVFIELASYAVYKSRIIHDTKKSNTCFNLVYVGN